MARPDSMPDNMIDDVSLQAAAASMIAVETAASFETLSNIVLGETFTKPEDIARFGKQPRSQGIGVFKLHDIIVEGNRALLYKNQGRVRETAYLVHGKEYDDARADTENAVFVRDPRDIVVGFNRVYRNYYHWLIQCVPALYWSVRGADRSTKVLALPELEQWQEDTLALLGIAEWDRVKLHQDVHYHFDNVVYCDFLRGIGSAGICRSLVEPFAVMKQRAALRPTGMKYLYLSRADATNRPIGNEAEVIDLMRSRGFTVIVPGQLPLNEQISAFHDAEIIVGAHGAGLSSVVFSQPGRLVLELLQSDYMNPCFNLLCQVAGVDYRAEVIECSQDTDERPGDWGHYIHMRKWDLDLDILHNAIEKIAPLTRVAYTGKAETITAPAARQSPELQAAEVLAHVKNVGDVRGGLDAWVGIPRSGRWIEGFCITPPADVAPEEIEYKAVFDHTWSSPWTTAGQFCGCRGVSLPIFGFGLRLTGAAALTYTCDYAATFLDGSMVGPVADGSLCQAADSLAPLEAIRITLRRR
jgi:capsular polysaccharide biosynthesis protein